MDYPKTPEYKFIDFIRHPIYIFRLLKIKLGFSRCSKCGAKLGIVAPIEVYQGRTLRMCYLCFENKHLKIINDDLKKEIKLKDIELEKVYPLIELANKINSGQISFFEVKKDNKDFKNG